MDLPTPHQKDGLHIIAMGDRKVAVQWNLEVGLFARMALERPAGSRQSKGNTDSSLRSW